MTALGGGAVTVAAGDNTNLIWTAGTGSYAATGYVIYRSKVDDTAASANLYPLFEVSVAELAAGYDGGGALKTLVGSLGDPVASTADITPAKIAEIKVPA